MDLKYTHKLFGSNFITEGGGRVEQKPVWKQHQQSHDVYGDRMSRQMHHFDKTSREAKTSYSSIEEFLEKVVNGEFGRSDAERKQAMAEFNGEIPIKLQKQTLFLGRANDAEFESKEGSRQDPEIKTLARELIRERDPAKRLRMIRKFERENGYQIDDDTRNAILSKAEDAEQRRRDLGR